MHLEYFLYDDAGMPVEKQLMQVEKNSWTHNYDSLKR